jgi:hypothetical protein
MVSFWALHAQPMLRVRFWVQAAKAGGRDRALAPVSRTGFWNDSIFPGSKGSSFLRRSSSSLSHERTIQNIEGSEKKHHRTLTTRATNLLSRPHTSPEHSYNISPAPALPASRTRA